MEAPEGLPVVPHPERARERKGDGKSKYRCDTPISLACPERNNRRTWLA
jgi:hypothetical protein